MREGGEGGKGRKRSIHKLSLHNTADSKWLVNSPSGYLIAQ